MGPTSLRDICQFRMASPDLVKSLSEQGERIRKWVQLRVAEFQTRDIMTKIVPEDRVSVLGSLLACFWILLLFLNSLSGNQWMLKVCKVNILALGVSLVALRYDQPLGCLPALIVCGFDVIFFAYQGLTFFYSIFTDIVKNIFGVAVAALIALVALLYIQALWDQLPKT